MGEQLSSKADESLKEYSFSLVAAHNAGQLTAIYLAACTPGKHSSFSSLPVIVSSLLNLHRAMIGIIGPRSVVPKCSGKRVPRNATHARAPLRLLVSPLCVGCASGGGV